MLKMGLHLEWLRQQHFKPASWTFFRALWGILSAHGYRHIWIPFQYFVGPKHFKFQTVSIRTVNMDSWRYIYVYMILRIFPCFGVNVLVVVPQIPFCEYASWFPSCFHDSTDVPFFSRSSSFYSSVFRTCSLVLYIFPLKFSRLFSGWFMCIGFPLVLVLIRWFSLQVKLGNDNAHEHTWQINEWQNK